MEAKRQLDVLDQHLEGKEFMVDEYSIADIAIFLWYGGLVLNQLYNAAEFLDVKSYKNVLRWAQNISQRPAVQRGLLVNKAWGENQMPERHSMEDFKKMYKYPIIITVAYCLVYYGFLLNIARTRISLHKKYNKEGKKFDRYFGQDRNMLAADRIQLNMLGANADLSRIVLAKCSVCSRKLDFNSRWGVHADESNLSLPYWK